MGIGTVITGIGAVEKLIPVIEAISAEVGPVVKAEVADGEAIWTDVLKAISDLKAAIGAIKAAYDKTQG